MIETTIYLHHSKEYNCDTAAEIGLSDKALETFVYTCYEVSVKIQINPETGEAEATHFQGVKLEHPVAV
jgi:hypothetical protein